MQDPVPNPALPPHVHVASVRALLGVWAALVVLTVLTVGAARVDFGEANLWIALFIAVVKGSLVVLFFMHLLHDRPFNALIFIGAIVFVALFIGMTLVDTVAYQADLIPGYAPAMPH